MQKRFHAFPRKYKGKNVGHGIRITSKLLIFSKLIKNKNYLFFLRATCNHFSTHDLCSELLKNQRYAWKFYYVVGGRPREGFHQDARELFGHTPVI